MNEEENNNDKKNDVSKKSTELFKIEEEAKEKMRLISVAFEAFSAKWKAAYESSILAKIDSLQRSSPLFRQLDAISKETEKYRKMMEKASDSMKYLEAMNQQFAVLQKGMNLINDSLGQISQPPTIKEASSESTIRELQKRNEELEKVIEFLISYIQTILSTKRPDYIK